MTALVPLADDPHALHLTWNTPGFDQLVRSPEECDGCGRRTAFRKDGSRYRHRVEADNLLAPYCDGDTS